MNRRKTTTITVRVGQDIAERLALLSHELRRSRSSVAGEAIERLLAVEVRADQPLVTLGDLTPRLPKSELTGEG